jgi:hypothetical protein
MNFRFRLQGSSAGWRTNSPQRVRAALHGGRAGRETPVKNAGFPPGNKSQRASPEARLGNECPAVGRGESVVAGRLAEPARTTILLAGRGKSPPRLFPGRKTSGFHGRFTPGTSSITRSRHNAQQAVCPQPAGPGPAGRSGRPKQHGQHGQASCPGFGLRGIDRRVLESGGERWATTRSGVPER